MEMPMDTELLDLIHPGEILREEFMAPLGLSTNALALALRVPATRIGEIVREQRSITPATALRLARYFRTTPDLWLGLQIEYELRLVRREIGGQVEMEVQPRVA
jgi:addiction module HigA family antidote